jgi:hypothetical protein
MHLFSPLQGFHRGWAKPETHGFQTQEPSLKPETQHETQTHMDGYGLDGLWATCSSAAGSSSSSSPESALSSSEGGISVGESHVRSQ